MNISFELSEEIEEQIRDEQRDLNREAMEIYLMEQFRQARITHRQLEKALNLGFMEVEQLLKQRGLGQDPDRDETSIAREWLKGARSR